MDIEQAVRFSDIKDYLKVSEFTVLWCESNVQLSH